MAFCALLSCFFWSLASSLDIALHAQSKSEVHGWVAGSEVTTRGLRNALRDGQHFVEIFAPFAYKGLGDRPWDLFVIEGYSGPVEHVMRAVRRLNPKVVVLHWCLDTYPKLSAAYYFVDAWLTNSRFLATHGFRKLDKKFKFADHKVDRYFLALGVDPEEVRLGGSGWEKEQPEDAAEKGQLQLEQRSRRKVVYLGQPSPTKKLLVPTLLLIRDHFDLEIYGNAWDREIDDASTKGLVDCCWKGKLATAKIGALYSTAFVVLGTTEHAQRQLGMVNNRVFEALASGADHFLAVEERLPDDPTFDELEHLVENDDTSHVAYSPEDALTWLLALKNTTTTTTKKKAVRRRSKRVVEVHSYERRAKRLLSIYRGFDKIEERRLERLVIAYDGTKDDDRPFLLGLLPALLETELMKAPKRSFFYDLVDVNDKKKDWCLGAAMIIARGSIRSKAVSLVASLRDSSKNKCARPSGSRGAPRRQPTMLLLARDDDSGELFPEGDEADEECASILLAFDAVVYDSFFPLQQATPCGHPRATAAMGVDFPMLRERSEGWAKLEGAPPSPVGVRYETIGTRLRNQGEVEVGPRGDFDMLAALVAGARVTVKDPDENPDLVTMLQAVTSGEIPKEAFAAPALADHLHAQIEAAFDPPRANASVTLRRPQQGDVITCDQQRTCRLRAVVDLVAFVTPDDGVWCLRANDKELSCQGDTKLDLDASFAVDDGITHLTFHAVLRAGLAADLSDLPVVRQSPPVHCSLQVLLPASDSS